MYYQKFCCGNNDYYVYIENGRFGASKKIREATYNKPNFRDCEIKDIDCYRDIYFSTINSKGKIDFWGQSPIQISQDSNLDKVNCDSDFTSIVTTNSCIIGLNKFSLPVFVSENISQYKWANRRKTVWDQLGENENIIQIVSSNDVVLFLTNQGKIIDMYLNNLIPDGRSLCNPPTEEKIKKIQVSTTNGDYAFGLDSKNKLFRWTYTKSFQISEDVDDFCVLNASCFIKDINGNVNCYYSPLSNHEVEKVNPPLDLVMLNLFPNSTVELRRKVAENIGYIRRG